MPEGAGGNYRVHGTGCLVTPSSGKGVEARPVVIEGLAVPVANNPARHSVALRIRTVESEPLRLPLSSLPPLELPRPLAWTTRRTDAVLPPPLPSWATLPLGRATAAWSWWRRAAPSWSCPRGRRTDSAGVQRPGDGGHGGPRGDVAAVRGRYVGITTRQVQDSPQAQRCGRSGSPDADGGEAAASPLPEPLVQLDFVVLNEREVSDADGLFKYVLVVTDVFSRYLWTLIATNVQIRWTTLPRLVDGGVLRAAWNDGRGRSPDCLHTLIPYLHLFLTEEGRNPAGRPGVRQQRWRRCRRYGVSLINSRAVTPQTNGRVERINQSFKTLLKAYQLERRNYSWVQTLLELRRGTTGRCTRRRASRPSRCTRARTRACTSACAGWTAW